MPDMGHVTFRCPKCDALFQVPVQLTWVDGAVKGLVQEMDALDLWVHSWQHDTDKDGA